MGDIEVIHMTPDEREDEVIRIIESAFFISNGIKLFGAILLSQSEPTIGKHVWEIRYRLEELFFEEIRQIKKASELKIGDFILFKKAVLEIDDIDLEFLNDEVEDGREVAIEARHYKKFVCLGNEEIRSYIHDESEMDESNTQGN